MHHQGYLGWRVHFHPTTLAITEWERHPVVILSCVFRVTKLQFEGFFPRCSGLTMRTLGLRFRMLDLGQFRALGPLGLLCCPIGPTLPEHTEFYW